MSPNQPLYYEIDNVDRGILSALLHDGRTPYSEIAKELGVSSGTIHVRIEKLKEAGVIRGSALKVDFKILGYDLIAFVGINLEHSREYGKVLKKLQECAPIVEAYYTTGKYNIFTKVVVQSMADLYRFLTEELQLIPGVQSTETIMIMDKPIERELSLKR